MAKYQKKQPRQIVQRPDAAIEAAGVALAQVELDIAKKIVQAESVQFEIAELITRIEDERLYLGAFSEEGNPYTSMKDYYPALLKKMRQAGRLHKLEERTVREWVRLYKVFVLGLQIDEGRILSAGTSHFSEIAEALDYDRKTGEIALLPRVGKIGRDEALTMIEELEARKEEGIPWRVQDTRETLDEQRGVVRRSVELVWGKSAAGARLLDIIIWEGATAVRPTEAGCSRELAEWLNKRLSAVSNLPEA
jgi:hypothetical protein